MASGDDTPHETTSRPDDPETPNEDDRPEAAASDDASDGSAETGETRASEETVRAERTDAPSDPEPSESHDVDGTSERSDNTSNEEDASSEEPSSEDAHNKTSKDQHDGSESEDGSGPPSDEGTSLEGDDGNDEPDETRSVENNLRALETILRGTRRSRRRTLWTEGALWYGAALGAVVASALLVAFILPEAIPGVTRWILWLGGGATTLGGFGVIVNFLRSRRSLSSMARALERVRPEFRNNIIAALEFGRQLTDRPEADDRELGFSRMLAATHLQRTVDSLREHAEGDSDLSHLLPDRLLMPPLLATVGIGSLVLASAALAPATTLEVLRSPTTSTASTSSDDSGPDVRPIVGNLRIKYTTPSYTGRGVRTEPHSSGHVEAVEGSEVTLTAVPLDGVEDVEIVLTNDEGERTIPMKRTQAGRVRANLVVTREGSYQFHAERSDGSRITDGVERSIDVISDEAPDVTITSHEGRVEVSPEDVLEIEFTVHDDYGIETVERVHYFAGSKSDKTTKPVSLPALTETPENVDGTIELDLRSMSLEPKDVVVFYLEATDNNSATGAGTGRSDKLTLRVESPEDEHLQNIQAQKRISEKLLLLLADYLERPMGEREPSSDRPYRQIVDESTSAATRARRLRSLRDIHRREGELLGKMDELVDRLQNDPLMAERDVTLFEGLHGRLQSLHDRGSDLYDAVGDGAKTRTLETEPARRVADYLGDVERTMETSILRLQELIASQKMDAIKSTQKDIEKLKDRLERLLKRYKKTQDPELKKAIQREIKRLRQRMGELMQRMQMQIRKLPQRHLNKEALKQRQLQSKSKNLSDNLKSIEEKLEQDDIDGALKALEQMDSNLKSLGQKMDKQFSGAQPRGLSKLHEKMSKLMDEANNLRSMEQDLEKKTREIQRKQAKRRQKKIDQMLDDFIPKMLRKVDAQLTALDAIARKDLRGQHQQGLRTNRKRLEALRESLEQRDIKQALESARTSLDHLRTLQFNLDLSKRHASPESERGRAFDESVERVESMIPRGESIRDALERMMERAQSKLKRSEQKELKKLSKRQKKIEKRAQKLEKRIQKASKEFPMMKQKLQPSMKKAKQEMKRAGKRLAEGKPQGALDSERGALQQLNQLKKAMKQTIKKQQQKNRQSRNGSGGRSNNDPVEIPGQQEGASREELRRELMEAMKKDKLKDYEGEIQQYYKSLVE